MATEARALTGRWSGHYVQRDQLRAITAEFRQDGDALEGTMRDEQTSFVMTVYEMAAECGLPPGADEQIVKALRHQYPDRSQVPIKALMTLPGESAVEGEVRGRNITFRKTYRGEAFSGYTVGEQRVGVTVRGHAVQYRGRVDEGGGQIDGTWWIDADPRRGVRRTEGSFVLRRLSE
jgi:hypothetical protein